MQHIYVGIKHTPGADTVHLHWLQWNSFCGFWNWPVQSILNLQDDFSIKDSAMSLHKKQEQQIVGLTLSQIVIYASLFPFVPFTVFIWESFFLSLTQMNWNNFSEPAFHEILSPLLSFFLSQFFFGFLFIFRKKTEFLGTFLQLSCCTYIWQNTKLEMDVHKSLWTYY